MTPEEYINGHDVPEDFWSGITNKAALDLAWPIILPLVEEMLEFSRGESSPQGIYNMILEKRYQLWIINAYEGICVTELVPFEKFTTLNVVGFAGISLSRGLKLLHDVLVPFAKEQGASVIRDYAGRRGVVKQLIKEGWDTAYYVMELKL